MFTASQWARSWAPQTEVRKYWTYMSVLVFSCWQYEKGSISPDLSFNLHMYWQYSVQYAIVLCMKSVERCVRVDQDKRSISLSPVSIKHSCLGSVFHQQQNFCKIPQKKTQNDWARCTCLGPGTHCLIIYPLAPDLTFTVNAVFSYWCMQLAARGGIAKSYLPGLSEGVFLFCDEAM